MGKSNPFSGLAYLNEAAYAALSFQDTIPIIESSDENAYRMTLSQLGQYIAEYSPTGNVIADTVTVNGTGTPLQVTAGGASIFGDLEVGGVLNLSTALDYSELDLTDSIVNADIATGAAIDVTKFGNGAARQLIQTNAAGDGVEWTGSIDLPGTLDVTGAATLDTSLTIAGTVTVDGVIDDDTMATASATKLSTSESIKAYVDNNAGATSMAIDGDTGTGSVNLLTQTFSIAGTANEIETSASGQTITIGLPSTIVADVTGDVSGNAGTADALSSQRTFALTGDVTGSVNSDLTSGASIITAIAAGSIVNADISSSAAISVGKLSAGSLNQLLVVGATGAEWANNVDVPGTLDVTGAATLDTSLTIAGTVTVNGIINDNTLATASATTLATSSSIKAYVDSQTGSAPALSVAGDTGTGSVDLTLETFTVSGTANEIETSMSGQTLTIGLPSSITANVTGNVTGDVSGNAGTATALSSSRTFALTGDVTGSTSSDLTSGASIATAIANLAVSKLQSGATGRQLLQTNATATGVEWASNIDIPGTLDVTGVATFDGGIVGSLSGNAATATALDSSRTFALTGDVTGSVSSNLASGVSISTAIAAGSIVDADINASAAISDTKLATISTGGKVANSATTATNNNTANTIVQRNGSGDFSAGTITATLSGNATTASTLQTARTISLGGDCSGSVSFNGGSNVTLTATVLDDSHNHIISNVDGLQSALDAKLNLSGGTMTGLFKTRTATANTGTSGSTNTIEVMGSTGVGATMSFHRAGAYAVNMGLDSDNVFRIGGWSASANRLQMDMSGNLTMAGNVTAYSDVRLKKDIKQIDNAIERVLKIRGVTFKRTDDDLNPDKVHAGVIAQEVEAVLPEVVETDSNGTKSVAYGNLVGLLIEAVKEQQQQIEKLTALVEAK